MNYWFREYFLSLKNILRCCFFIFLFIPNNLYAQSSLLKSKVSVNKLEVSAKELISILETNYEINFSYSDNILPDKILKTKAYKNVSLEQFLTENLLPVNIHFKELGNQIVLFKKEPVKREFYITGFINEANSKENLIGVAIYIHELKLGTVSNAYGYYSLKLKEGTYTISYSYIGYEPIKQEFELKEDSHLNIELLPSRYIVNEVVVKPKEKDEILESVMMNTSSMGIATLRSIPGLFGENDVVRNISILPGVQQSEVSSGNINVRGGSSNQTVFLMDEAKIYNAGHFGGFFSIFNPDAVNNVQVYKADLPVDENGAISSIIDVKMREGDKKDWRIKGSLGLIDIKGSVEGPIKKDKTSVLLAFRRTYMDAYLNSLDLGDAPTLKFYFYDLNFKINSKLNNKNLLYFSGYTGTDFFSLFNKIKRSNYIASLRWNHIFGNKLFFNSSLVASRNNMQQNTINSKYDFKWRQQINSIETKIKFDYLPYTKLRFKFGLSSETTKILPFSIESQNPSTFSDSYIFNEESLYLNYLFASTKIALSPNIHAGFGFRSGYCINPNANLHIDSQNNQVSSNNAYYSKLTFEPQIHVRYKITKNLAIKLSYNKQISPLHRLPVSELGISTNRWMPANSQFNPSESNNFSAGLYKIYNNWLKGSIEVYYRTMSNLIEAFHDERILYSSNLSEHLKKGNANAYGTDFMLMINRKKYTGIISYNYMITQWSIRGLNKNNPYPAMHDRPHNFRITNSFHLNNRITLSANWTFSSGAPYTKALGTYSIHNKKLVYFDEDNLNEMRLPNYHRLDLGVSIAGKKNNIRKWKGFWNFSVYNAYFRKNPLGIIYYNNGDLGEEKIHFNPRYLFLYQFVPSFSYKFEF